MDAILRLLIFLRIFINVSIAGQSAQAFAGCPSSVPRNQRLKAYDGQCLQFVMTETSWTSAKSDCSSIGGSLVMIKNAGKQNFIYNTLRSLHWKYHGLWIGASDIDKEGTWVWVDGTPVSYGNWYPGEGPTHRGFLFSSSSYEDCAVLRYSSGGSWQDYSCDSIFHRYSYICEYDLATTSTTQSTMKTSVTTEPRSTSVVPSTTSPSTLKTDTAVISNTAGLPNTTSSLHTTLRRQRNGSTSSNIFTTMKTDVTKRSSTTRSTTEEHLTTMGEEATTILLTFAKSQSTRHTTLTPSLHTTVHRPTRRLTPNLHTTVHRPTSRLTPRLHTTVHRPTSRLTNRIPVTTVEPHATSRLSTRKQSTSTKLQTTVRFTTKLKPKTTSNPLNLHLPASTRKISTNDKTADLFSPSTQTVSSSSSKRAALKPNTSVHPTASTNETLHNQYDASNDVPNRTSDKTGKTGFIVGLVIGMLALLAVLVFGGIFVRRRRSNNRTPKLDALVHENKLYDVTCGTESTA